MMEELIIRQEEGFAEKAVEEEGRASRVTAEGVAKKYQILHDPQRCIGCFGCEVHCKLEHNLPVGPRLCRLVQVGPKFMGGKLQTIYLSIRCMHCDTPSCQKVCPTGAIIKREDGIVYIDEDACIGCKACIWACPFGAPQLCPKKGKVIKCDYCKERVDAGLLPACVEKCSTRALYFGNINEFSTLLRERYAKNFALILELQKEGRLLR